MLEVVERVEALEPEEALFVVLTVELSAAERAEMLHEIQQVVDVLRRRGGVPRVVVRRSENGELHARCRSTSWREGWPPRRTNVRGPGGAEIALATPSILGHAGGAESRRPA